MMLEGREVSSELLSKKDESTPSFSAYSIAVVNLGVLWLFSYLLAYENGAVWFMTKKTFMSFVGMVDEGGQPIARVDHGIGGRPERTLLGRQVVLNDYMDSYADTVTKNTTFAFLFNPSDYVLNESASVTIKKYEDNETDDLVTKAIMLVDGKVIDKGSLVKLTKAKKTT